MNVTKFIANGAHPSKGIDNWVDNLFEGLFANDDLGRKLSYGPAVNVAESTDGFYVDFAVPGFKKEDFKIQVEKDTLTVSAEKKTEEVDQAKKYSRKEFNYTSFQRSFTLPKSADLNRIGASYNEGILQVSIAKKEEEKAVSKAIEVK